MTEVFCLVNQILTFSGMSYLVSECEWKLFSSSSRILSCWNWLGKDVSLKQKVIRKYGMILVFPFGTIHTNHNWKFTSRKCKGKTIIPSGWAIFWKAVGAIMIGMDILKPKTVVVMSILLTSIRIRGRNLYVYFSFIFSPCQYCLYYEMSKEQN